MGAAVRVLAQQRAIKAAKRQFQAQGLKPQRFDEQYVVPFDY